VDSEELKKITGWAIAGLAAIAAAVTNPDFARFRSWAMEAETTAVGRMTCTPVQTGNFVVFSTYMLRCPVDRAEYIGVFNNFIRTGYESSLQSPS